MTNAYLYNMCLFKNCLIFSCLDVSDKNIVKRFTIHNDLYQIKGLYDFIKSNPILIGKNISYDCKIIETIVNEYESISTSIDFDDFYKKVELNNNIYKSIFELNDLKKFMIKTKDSIYNYNFHIKNISSSFKKDFRENIINTDNIIKANEYNFKMLLDISLVFYGSFNVKSVNDFLINRNIKMKSNIPVESTISMF